MTERLLASFVPLVDCAVLVVARELGFAAAEGLTLDLVKEPSWASLRDHLCLGHVDCAHALAPLPVALALGAGYVKFDCAVPLVLGRGGNAITVSARLCDEMHSVAGGFELGQGPRDAGEALARVVEARAEPLTFGMVFPFSNHNFELRYWLASAGLHPDRDVRLVAIPPPLMVEAMSAGLVDGFCVGEPWNSLAVTRGFGYLVATQSQLFPRAVEKVLAVRAAFGRDSARLGRLLRALDAAAAWADAPANHAPLARLLAHGDYVGAPAELIEAALGGRVPLGSGKTARDPDFMFFHRHGAGVPSAADGLSAYAQMVRWGQTRLDPAQQARAAAVFRPDLLASALGTALPAAPQVRAFDGARPVTSDVAGYLAQFALSTPFAEHAAV